MLRDGWSRRRHDEPGPRRTALLAGPHHLGRHRGRRSGGIAARVLMARSGDRLRTIAGRYRLHLHRVRGRRRSTGGHRRGVRSRWIVRGDRGGRSHWLGMATRDRAGRPWTQGLVATPHPLRSQHSLVAPILRCRRLRRRSSDRRRDRSWLQPPRLAVFSALDQRATRAMRSPRKAASSPTQPSRAEARVCCHDRPKV